MVDCGGTVGRTVERLPVLTPGRSTFTPEHIVHTQYTCAFVTKQYNLIHVNSQL